MFKKIINAMSELKPAKNRQDMLNYNDKYNSLVEEIDSLCSFIGAEKLDNNYFNCLNIFFEEVLVAKIFFIVADKIIQIEFEQSGVCIRFTQYYLYIIENKKTSTIEQVIQSLNKTQQKWILQNIDLFEFGTN